MPPGIDIWNGTGNWLGNPEDWSSGSPPAGGSVEIKIGTVIVTTPVDVRSAQLFKIDGPATLQINGLGGELSADNVTNVGSIDISGGAQLTVENLNNTGSISISGSTLQIQGVQGADGTLSGAGSITLKSGATLTIDNSASGGTVVFAPGANAELVLRDDKDFHETISGLTVGTAGAKTDFIHTVAAGITISSVSGQGTTDGTVTLSDGAVLHLTDISSSNWFVATTAGPSGTDIYLSDIACYCRGTQILTDKGEVAVEDLAIGDAVATVSGQARPIKWIGRRSYGGRFIMGRKDILPICFKAGSLGEGLPRRDLFISPHHAMYLEGVLIEARDLVNGVSIVQAEQVEEVEYFHIELDSHDVIIAEGAALESFLDDDSRAMFHNAHEYSALYPGTAQGVACYCAARRRDGYEVETARHHIDALAGLRGQAETLRIDTLRGFVDTTSANCISGWAQNTDHPEAPVCLDVFADGRLIGRVLANRYRDDLQRAGLGSGRHGFEFTPPPGLGFAPGAVDVRRSLDGAALGFSTDALYEEADRRRSRASGRWGR
jgi:hypothetical protein